MEQETEDKVEKLKKVDIKIEKIQAEKIRGRIIILDPENSEFAKNLNLTKKGDYNQKK